MCRRCENLLTVKPGEKRVFMMYDMSGRYADVNTYNGHIEVKYVGNHKIATMTHVLHCAGRKYESTTNIHNCPYCGERLV